MDNFFTNWSPNATPTAADTLAAAEAAAKKAKAAAKAERLEHLSKLLSYGIIIAAVVTMFIIIAGVVSYCHLYRREVFEAAWRSEEQRKAQELKRLEEERRRREEERAEAERLKELERWEARRGTLMERSFFAVGGFVAALVACFLCIPMYKSIWMDIGVALGIVLTMFLGCGTLMLLVKYSFWTGLSMASAEMCSLFIFLTFYTGSLDMDSTTIRMTSIFQEANVGGQIFVKLTTLAHIISFICAIPCGLLSAFIVMRV